MNITLSNIEKMGIIREEALGRIYEGLIQETNRKVIIKELILPPSLDKKSGLRIRLRFVKEAQAMKTILNPMLSMPLAIGEEETSAYIVYALPPGIPLITLVQTKGAMPETDALQTMKNMIHCYQCLASAGIHRVNVIPNDFYLSGSHNLQMVDTCLCAYEKASGLLDAGFLAGDRAFYAPEQIEKGKTSELTMTFSLGLALYWMLTGNPLYEGDTPFETLSQIMTKTYSSLPQQVAASIELYDLMRQILQKEETRRFPTLALLDEGINRVMERERIEHVLEHDLKEHEEKYKTDKIAVPTAEAAGPIRKILVWAIIFAVVIIIGLQLKKWFFEGYEKVPVSSPESMIYLGDAQAALREGKWKEAYALAYDVLAREKINPLASLIMGEAYMGVGKYKEALPHLLKGEKAVDEKTQFLSRIRKAECLVSLERFRDANLELERLLGQASATPDISPLDPYKDTLINLCLRESIVLVKNFTDTSSQLPRIKEIEKNLSIIAPDSIEMDFIRGYRAFLDNDIPIALECIERYGKKRPEDEAAVFLLDKIKQSSNANLK